MKCGNFGACFFVQQVARYGSVISYCSVHLDARMIPPRYGMKCSDFCVCFFVQQVARYGGFTGVHYFKKVYVDYSELR